MHVEDLVGEIGVASSPRATAATGSSTRSSRSSGLYCTASTTMKVTWQRAQVTSTVRCDSACFSILTSQLSRLRAQAGQL